jgi:hypothetical protein
MTPPSEPAAQLKPILVQILAYAPTQYFHCQHCELIWHQVGAGTALHREQLDSSIPEDLKTEYAGLSDWVRQLVETYGGRVVVKVVDAASPEGLINSLRYRVRRYPAFVVEGRTEYVGADFAQARQRLDARLAAQTRGGARGS